MRFAKRLLVIVWEGADWGMIHPLLDAGQMPHLESIVSAGVMGELSTLQPQLAPMLSTSLATGMRGDKHGVLGYLDADADQVRPASMATRRKKAMWELLSEHGLRCHVLNWPTYPAENTNGVFVSPLYSRLRPDSVDVDYSRLPRSVSPSSAAAELQELLVNPRELGPAEILPFVPDAARVRQDRDPGLAIIASYLAEWTSQHAIATHVTAEHEWDVVFAYYDAIDRFGHAFMRFHPPRIPGLPQGTFELYRHVMQMVYRYSDMQLGSLLQLAGDDATVMVVSPHGFRSGTDRPHGRNHGRGQVSWHRPLGILAMRGPHLRRDEWIWGGSILDVCPTVLALVDVPPPRDVDGQPLVGAFATAPTIKTCPLAADSSGAKIDLVAEEHAALVQQLLDDGYIEMQHIEVPDAGIRAVDAQEFNLAQVYLESGRIAEARPLFEKLAAGRLHVARFALYLARCCLALGEYDRCRELIDRLLQMDVPSHYPLCLRAELLLLEGKHEQALEQLFLVEQSSPRRPGIHSQIGRVYLAMQRYEEAEQAFKKELQRDGDDIAATFGLGYVAEVRADWESALGNYRKVIAVMHYHPDAHFRSANALLKLGRSDEAIAALERCLQQRQDFVMAHETLLALRSQQ